MAEFKPSCEPAQPRTYYCNKCGHYGPDGPSHVRSDGAMCDYLAAGIGPFYTAAQLAAEVAAAVAKERERAARICESVNNHDNPMTANDCAAAIRTDAEGQHG